MAIYRISQHTENRTQKGRPPWQVTDPEMEALAGNHLDPQSALPE